MNQLWLAVQGGLQVLAVSLLLGAGLPALFALGMRSLAYGSGGIAGDDTPHPIGKVVAYICFGVVIAAVVMGIVWVAATGLGYRMSFENVIPTFVKKR